MKLREWCEKAGWVEQTHTNGQKYLVGTGLTPQLSWDLYHLEDYAVSTVSGPTVWLVAR